MNTSTSFQENDIGLVQSIERTESESPVFRVDKTLRSLSSEEMDISPESPRYSVDTIRRLNRAITRKIPKRVVEELINERQNLVKKKFSEGLTQKEEKRLIFVNWQLDRVDDAETGDEMDRLEKMIELYENFAEDIDNMRKWFISTK